MDTITKYATKFDDEMNIFHNGFFVQVFYDGQNSHLYWRFPGSLRGFSFIYVFHSVSTTSDIYYRKGMHKDMIVF